MSIASEITRISGNVSDALDAIEAKGVEIPTGANSDDLASLIASIPTGGSGITVVETEDSHGGTIVSITGEEVALQSKTVIPTISQQIITPDTGYTGLNQVTVNPINYSWLGLDATLVHEITPITIALKDTDFNTWTPSTTGATVVTSRTLSDSTQKYVATDLLVDGGYDYINVWNMKLPVVYTGTPTQKAMPVFACGLLVQAIFRRYSSFVNLTEGNLNNNVAAQQTLATFLRYYGSTTGTITYTNSASYGFYFANVVPTISSTTARSPTITLKTPTMSARCSSTYMSTTNAELIDKEKTKLTYTCKVYRVKQDSYLQGFYRYLAERVTEMV